MEFTFIEDGIDAVVIDNFYSDSQLEDINKELCWMTKPSIMTGPENLATATDEKGGMLSSKKGIFLEEVFKNWRHSSLISYPWENLNKKEVVENILSFNGLYKSLYRCNSRSHLLSYYENSDYYKPHFDVSFFTFLSYFHKEPKCFDGGEIRLSSYDNSKFATVEIKNNRVVLISSSTLHEVLPIKSKNNTTNTLSGNGRYCCSVFLTISDQVAK